MTISTKKQRKINQQQKQQHQQLQTRKKWTEYGIALMFISFVFSYTNLALLIMNILFFLILVIMWFGREIMFKQPIPVHAKGNVGTFAVGSYVFEQY